MLIHAVFALALTAGSFASQPSSASPAHRSFTHRSLAVVAPERHTTFGVAIAPVPDRVRKLPYLLDDEGVILTEVRAGGAASAADLRAGDIILSVAGKRVDESTLFSALRDCPRDQAFRVEFLRGGKWKEAWVTIDN